MRGHLLLQHLLGGLFPAGSSWYRCTAERLPRLPLISSSSEMSIRVATARANARPTVLFARAFDTLCCDTAAPSTRRSVAVSSPLRVVLVQQGANCVANPLVFLVRQGS